MNSQGLSWMNITHFLKENRLRPIIRINRSMIVLIHFIFLSAQNSTDKTFDTCNKQRSLARWLSAESSVTEDQEKIDISYYGLDIEIDIANQEVVGSVLVKGSVGMNQPDSIEFNLSSIMNVDSILFYGEITSFDH